jgi:hypothetical protein
MKTKTQTFYVLLILLIGMMLSNPVQGQTVATPTVFTTLAAGSQTVTGASINGPESWFKWTTGDGVTMLNAKITQQGSVYRNSTAEFYTVLSVDSIKRVFVDSLNNDSTLHLVAGYLNSGDQIYIRFVNVNSACATCFNLHPLVDFEVFSTMANCSPSIPCSLVRNGGFENNSTSVCGGISIEDGVDCWYTYENTTDVYRRNCFPNSFNWNNLGVSTQNTNPPLNAHSPNPNNTIAGQYCRLSPNHLAYEAYNESIQSLLAAPLISGHTYSLSCWLFNYSGQINTSNYSNPMSHPVVMTIGTSTGIISTNSSNPGINSLYPFNPSINQLTSFVVTPVNVWTQYTYTFTYSGPSQSSLLIGPNILVNQANGNINRTDNITVYVALDDINITEITPLTTTSAVICEGKTATLTASGMNTYVWQPGNTSGSSISANPIVTTVYTVTGTYGAGCTKTNTASVTVNPLPTITMATPSIAICPGGSAALSAYGGVSYTWSPCPANCNLNALVVSPSVSTTYTVTGLASGCTNTATAYVQILNASNSINITGSTIVCPGQNAFLQASGATNYTWSPCTSGCNSATLAPTPSVTTTYTVRGINSCGVLSTSTVVVMVQTVYPILPDVLSGPVCPNYSVTLIANGGSPYSYTWTPGNLVGSNVTVTPSVTTTYTVCTTVFQCPSNCAAVTVTVMPVPQLTITPTSFSVCPGTSTNISVSGASTYTWSTGDFGANVVVTPTASTVYTVSGSVHSCPTLTATSTAYVYPALTATSAIHVSNCPGANSSITASGGTGTYTWTPGGMTGPSIVVSPTVPTVYTVVSSVAGCTLTANVTVNPVICCAVTTAATFTTTSGSLNGGTFNLNGSLYLSADMTLDNVTIFMGSTAEIVVPNNMKLTLNKCHLLGCPQMWKGIRAMGPNGSIHITKNSLIEDAITAVDVSAVTTPVNSSQIFFIETCTFNKNHTAIKAANYNTNVADYPLHLADNVFTSRKLYTSAHQLVNPALPLVYNWPVATNALLKGFASMPDVFDPDINLSTGNQFSVATYSSSTMEIPNAGSVSHQGIELKNIFSTNGSITGFRMTAGEMHPYTYGNFDYYNVFDNMHFGINAENSSLLIAHAAFQNMSQYVSGYGGVFLPIKYYDGGMGINSVGTTANGLGSSQVYLLIVKPVAANSFNKSTNFFINNPYGIKTENIQNIVINYNVFHSNRTYSPNSFPQANSAVGQGEYAVYIKSLDYRAVNVKRNFTANINNAMIFQANAATFIGSLQIQYGGSMNIQSNILKANYGSTINASQSMQQAIAVDNLISASTNLFQSGPNSPVIVSNNIIDKAFSGISVTNWNRQRIIDNSNTVTLANDGTNYSQYAIRHSNNLGDNMIGNTVKGFGTTKQRVYAVMASENKGQSFWCNSSDNSYYGTVFSGSQNLTSWKQNVMSKHVQAMRLDNTTIGQQGATGQPINNTWTGSWTGAFKTYVNGTIDPGSSTGNSKLYLSTLPSNSENGATFSAFRYKTIVPQSLYLTTGSSGVVCSSMQPANPEPAQFTGYQGNLHSIVKNVYEYGNYLTGNRKNGKLAVYRILLEDSTLLATDTILQNFKIASDAGNIGKFFKVEQYLSEGNYKDAEGRLSAITPVDSVELGLKKLYKIYLHSKTNAYDATDESDLIALANSCPAQMGIGVYQARVLLNSIYDVYFHYESDCGNTDNVAYRQIRNTDDSADTPSDRNFMVYPNPSSGVVYFTASNMGIESYEVTVYDISGKAIFIKEYTDGEKVNSIDLNLSNGIYLMQLTDSSNGEVHKQKFVIQK